MRTVLCDSVSPDLQEPQTGEKAALLRTMTPPTAVSRSEEPKQELLFLPQHVTEEERVQSQEVMRSGVVQQVPEPGLEPLHTGQPSRSSGSQTRSRQRRSTVSIERSVQEYLESQRKGKRRPKTLEWHQTALHLFQQYLREECQCVGVDQITETEVLGWITFLHEKPTARGTFRSTGTLQSYARSVRAFCQWLVCRRYLSRTPFMRRLLPQVGPPLLHLLEPAEWGRLLQACQPGEGSAVSAEQAARNRALLWVLAETGTRACEVCGLRLGDVDRERGLLRVKGKDARWRWVPLGAEGLHHLLGYVDGFCLQRARQEKRKRVGEEPLFVAETGRALTENSLALMFGRLRQRAGITRKGVNPTLLRESFAVRYLQEGGDVFTLRERLGQEESAPVKRYLRMSER
jgi:site-specific recombinase XerD